MTDTNWHDDIVEEVRAIREDHAATHGYDLHRVFEDLKAKERASQREVVDLSTAEAVGGAKEPVRRATAE